MQNPESPFYTADELLGLGFSSVGREVQVSRLARFYGVSGKIGDKVRIDDFCIFKGQVEIGSFVHIAAFCMVSGTAGRVVFSDFSGLAARVSIYTGTDNYKGENLTNPMAPASYRDDVAADVILSRGVIIGAHSIILPGAKLAPFASVGALCVVNDECEPGATLVSGGGRARQAGKKDAEKLNRLADEVMAQWKSQN